MPLVYNYNFKHDDEGNKIAAWIFSALGNACAFMDFNNAMDQGEIGQQVYDALVANLYGGDIPPQPEDWLPLT